VVHDRASSIGAESMHVTGVRDRRFHREIIVKPTTCAVRLSSLDCLRWSYVLRPKRQTMLWHGSWDFSKLPRAQLRLFPRHRERMDVPNEQGVYVIYSPGAKKVVHVGRTYRGTARLRQRLSVCRQSISDSWLGNLRECLAHLV
jgi:hypothetical protein